MAKRKIIEPEVISVSVNEVKPIFDINGNLKILRTDDHGRVILCHTKISAPVKPHYHEQSTEFCYVLKGSGIIIIRDTVYHYRADKQIMILPYSAHYIIPDQITKVITFYTPPKSNEDEFELERSNRKVGFFQESERLLLINKIFKRMGVDTNSKMDEKERESANKYIQKVFDEKIKGAVLRELREQLRILSIVNQ